MSEQAPPPPSQSCPRCGAASPLLDVGSASGRPTYDCPEHGAWREKNPAAVALGRNGGIAAQAKLSKAERRRRSKALADKRWRDVKLSRNKIPEPA